MTAQPWPTPCDPAIDRMDEPVPTDAFRRVRAEDYDRPQRQPGFILFRARRMDG